MTVRMSVSGLAVVAAIALGGGDAAGQISGRVVLREGPIGVEIVFGQQSRVVVGSHRAPRARVVENRQPVRYEPGMSLLELERYLHWVEVEYDTFKHMDEDEAWYRLGWTEQQLDDHVDWLKDERKFLKKEHKRLRRQIRDRGYDPRQGNRSRRGRGR